MKKKDKNFVENYRPVPVLPTVSKMSEGIMQKQINSFIGKCLYFYSLQKRIQYTVCFAITDRKVEIMPRQARFYRGFINGSIKSLWCNRS